MSTAYILLPLNGDDSSLPALEVSEQSMEYEITCWLPLGTATEYVEFSDLSADDVLNVALKMIQVVLYQHPEKIDWIRSQIKL